MTIVPQLNQPVPAVSRPDVLQTPVRSAQHSAASGSVTVEVVTIAPLHVQVTVPVMARLAFKIY